MINSTPAPDGESSRSDFEKEVVELRKEVRYQSKRLSALENSDRLQTEHIKIIRRLQLACVGLIALGYALTKIDFKEPGTQEALERVAVGLIATAASGLAGSEFLKPSSKEASNDTEEDD